MLPKLELEVIAEASREVSVGDLEDEESSHLVDEVAAAKLAKSLPASADIAIRGEEAPAPAPLALRVGKASELLPCLGDDGCPPTSPPSSPIAAASSSCRTDVAIFSLRGAWITSRRL